MNIWLIQTGEPLPTEHGARKMRTAMLADRLIQRGHSVVWWSSAFDHLKKKWLVEKDAELPPSGNMKIMLLRGTGYKKNVSITRVIDHRIVARRFKSAIKDMPLPDAIVASLPPHDLAYEAVKFARQKNIPVIVDIRDPWPDIFLDVLPRRLKAPAKVLLFRDFSMLKTALKHASSIVAVTNTFLDWGLAHAERAKKPRDRTFYLGYTRDAGKACANRAINGLKKNAKKFFTISFIGTFAHYHNPSILLECAGSFLKEDPDIRFVIAGDGEETGEIKKKTKDLTNVILPGWLDKAAIDELLEISDVGVCPSGREASLFPNKAFLYLSAGLPVISAFSGELKDLLEHRKAGHYYKPGDVDGLRECIKRLHDDHTLYKKTSQNAMSLFNELFDAEKIYREYAEFIEGICYKTIK